VPAPARIVVKRPVWGSNSDRKLTKFDLVVSNSFFNGIKPLTLLPFNCDKSLREQLLKICNVFAFNWNSKKVCTLYGKFMHAYILNAVKSNRPLVIKAIPDGDLAK
jgi:hypothetical protein